MTAATSRPEWSRERAVIRQRLLEAREGLSAAVRAAACARIEVTIEALLARLRPERLGFCWPIRGEFDPLPVVRRHLARGGRSALPWVATPRSALRWRMWREDSTMASDRLGIPYPLSGEEIEPDLVLIPVVGFDPAGYRLGYGGGYFDRTMAAAARRPVAIGVGFELGRLESIRPEPHDVALDYIVTEAGILEPRRSAEK